jgi:hypothetical protein
MGSFNTSCFVSRQTIAGGDPCRIVAIMQSRSWDDIELTYDGVKTQGAGFCSSTCYPDRFWRPVSNFIEAKYDDYGRFELADSPQTRSALGHFITDTLRQAPVVTQGDNEYHDVPFDLQAFMAKDAPKLFEWLTVKESTLDFHGDAAVFEELVKTWDYIWNVAQEERMFWADLRRRLVPMSFAVMHESAYQALIKIAEAPCSYRGKRDMRTHFDNSLRAMRDYQAEVAAEVAQAPVDEGTARFHQRYAFNRFMDELKRAGAGNCLPMPGEAKLLYSLQDPFLAGELTEDQLFKALLPTLSARYVQGGLEELNLHFEPIVYATQDYSNEIGQAYAKLVSGISRQVTRAREVRYCGEYSKYHMIVAIPEVLFDALSKKAREWDSRLQLLEQQSSISRPGNQLVAFETTLSLELLQEFLQEFEAETKDNADFAMHRDTLQACAD